MTLKFKARHIESPATHTSQCAIVPVGSDKKLRGCALIFDRALGGLISETLALGDFSGKSGESMLLPGKDRIKRVLLIGSGEAEKFDRKSARQFALTTYRALNNISAAEATLHSQNLKLKDGGSNWLHGYLARTLVAGSYRYSETVSKPKPALQLKRLTVNSGAAKHTRDCQQSLDRGASIGAGMNEAKELANLPGNICTPNYLAQRARKLARAQDKLSCKVLDEKKMRELGMESLLSVSAGSVQPAKLIIMEYKGGKAKDQPYVLVGKGITFDSGGISLKPGAKMDEMKYDMGGAASVFGTLAAVSEMSLPINVVGIVAAAENMPNGQATKPGDVVTSMSGQTIEVLNTDAEGRLVLCDALTYSRRYKPVAVIDIATLTGACVVALGSHATGLYANQDELADQLLGAGGECHDRGWRMPLWDDYQAQLNSNFADIANIGGPGGGSITAACFLARFTKDLNWAHLDIAGTAWNSAPKGATGRPVPMLTQYLMDRAGL